jgi:transcriptional regulator with XRE-family HTH domain
VADQWRDDEPIDEVIARVRIDRGQSQQALSDDIARVSGDPRVTREYVSRWEHRKRIPTPYWREHLGQVLGIPREVLDRAAAVARMRRAADQRPPVTTMAPVVATTPSDDSSRTLEETLDLWDELMRRRDFLGGAGSIAATTLLPGGMPAAAAVLPSAADKAELFDTCARLTASYRQMDNLLGPSAVYGQVMDHHRRLSAWLQQARTATDRRRLGYLVTDSGDLLAWLCIDLDRRDQAAVLYRQAAEAARGLGDVSRQAYLVGRMSSNLLEMRQPDQGLLLAEGAERIAGTTATPLVRSWLAMIRAQAHASQGDERACQANLQRAAGLLDRATGEPREDYIGFWDAARLHRSSGRALLKLGERKTATLGEGRRAFDQALDMWPRAAVRDSAGLLTGAASARLAQGDIPETARLTGRAFEVAAKTGSLRVLRDISDLRARMRPYRHTRAVRELDERLLTSR